MILYLSSVVVFSSGFLLFSIYLYVVGRMQQYNLKHVKPQRLKWLWPAVIRYLNSVRDGLLIILLLLRTISISSCFSLHNISTVVILGMVKSYQRFLQVSIWILTWSVFVFLLIHNLNSGLFPMSYRLGCLYCCIHAA